MTARTRVTVYSVVLSVLVLVFVAGTVAGPRRGIRAVPLLPGLDPGLIRRIEISADGSTTLLEGEAGEWRIVRDGEPYPAREDRIESFLKTLAESRIVRRVTGSEALWPQFGVAEGDGHLITLTPQTAASGTGERTVIWGDASAEPGLSYARVGTAKDVVAADGELQFYLRQPSAYWSYLRLFPENLSTGDVIAVTARADGVAGDASSGDALSAGGGPAGYATRREPFEDGERWVDALGEPIEDAVVARLVRELVDLVASDFVSGSSARQQDVEPAALQISFDLGDGRSFAVRLDPDDGTYLAWPEGPGLPGDPFGGIVYRLEEQKVRRLFPEELTTSEGEPR